MKAKVLCTLFLSMAVMLLMVAVSWADVPPWPVNQQAYIPDGVFNTLDEAGCRACHEDPDVAFNGANIPNRHHNLVENPAKTINCDYTAAIFADCDGTPPDDDGKMYECLDCHHLVWNPVTFSYDFDTFRDCLFCHQQVEDQASVHHLTEAAQTSNCKKCHAPIDNPNLEPFTDTNNNGICDNNEPFTDTNGNGIWDGHYIPTYGASRVTPDMGLGTGTDDPDNPTGHTGQGGCAFCHGPLGDSTLTDNATGITVYSNAKTHHSTGVMLGPFEYGTPENRTGCLTCHNINDEPYINIRGCEQCHSVKTLHNIQVDSNNAGVCSDNGAPCTSDSDCTSPATCGKIVPGQELPYWGHIGANTDCNGCHLNAASAAAAPYSGPVIPDVSGLSIYTATAGVDTLVTVTGSAFTNTVLGDNGPIVVTSNVVLTAADGSTVTLTPSTVTESSMDVILPATLARGNYELRAVKGPSTSGPIVVAVIPAVTIDSAICSNGIVTISGSGFSQYVNATDSGTGVFMTTTKTIGKGRKTTNVTTTNPCPIKSWNDTKIVAKCGTSSGTIEVDSVYGSASVDVVVSEEPVVRPVKRPSKILKPLGR